MTKKTVTNNGHTKNKRKKSKYLLRRIAIVAASLLILWLLILMIGKGLKGSEPDTFAEEPSDTQTTLESSTSESGTESTSQSEETTQPGETTQTGETTQLGETTQSDGTAPQTDATTQSNATPDKTTTETPLKEGATMDFTSVPYYIQTLDARYQTYYALHKASSASDIVRDVNMNLDYAFYGKIENIDQPNALSVICNKYYQLPSDFTPDGLKSVPDGYFVADGKSYQLKDNALDAFIAMSDAAKEEGLSLRIISAYRSNSYQANLYQKYKNNNGQTAADRFSARPGHSEHETGLAIDINDVAQAFENTEEFTWLGKHAHEYGYVLRYPNGQENITGYMYEPWHYRYLGAEVATQLKTSGLTYDAYYAMYLLK